MYDIDEALTLRGRMPNSLVMGEEGGRPIEGFDYDNSPAQFVDADLRGKRMIQRTSNGVQGVVRSTQADGILTASFVCAGATADVLRARNPQRVTFVVTGWEDGEEDAACADYLEALLRDEQPAPGPYLDRVCNSWNGRRFATRPSTSCPRAICHWPRTWTALTSPWKCGDTTACCACCLCASIGAGLATDCGIYRELRRNRLHRGRWTSFPKDHCDQTESHLFTERIPLMPRIRRRHV